MDDKESRLLLTRHRFAAVSATIAVFLLTWLAINQDPHPDPFLYRSAWKGERLMPPMETNAFMRLPMIEADMRRLFTLPGTRHVWAVGKSPLVLHSADAGATWQTRDVRRRRDGSLDVAAGDGHDGMWLSSVVFIDPERGWAGGPAGLFVTEDGGAHWTRQLPANRIDAVSIAGRNGLAVGYDKASISRDGGRTWEELLVPKLGEVVAAAVLPGPGPYAWVATWDGSIWRTTTGRDWRPAFADERPELRAIQRLRFTDESRGEALTPNGIYATDDGGETWRPIGMLPSVRPRQPLTRWQETKRAWTLPFHPLIRREHEQASTSRSLVEMLTFMAERSPAYDSCRASGVVDDFVAVEGRHTIALVGSQICGSATDGATWKAISAPRQFVRQIHVRGGGEELWAAGGTGVILFSDDGGETWEPRNSGTIEELHAIAFAGETDVGWAAGNGTLFKTIDGGNEWTKAASFESDLPLTTIRLSPDGTFGVAHGEYSSHAYVTHDGGATWRPMQIPGTVDDEIFFIDHLHGWVLAGIDTELLHTADGGLTWSRARFPQHYSSMFFSDGGKRGWLGTHSLPIARTSDGHGWTRIEPEGNQWVRSFVFAPNGRRGWAADNQGTLYTTTDRGDTWRPERNVRALRPETMVFDVRGDRAWAVTEDGIPLRSTDGGRTWHAPEYRRAPAAWLYVGIVGVAAWFSIAFFFESRGQALAIDDAATNDAPVNSAEEDRLGFTRVANGIARLFGNSRTEPPLTVAITAPWGSGKTSLARLVAKAVRSYDFQPVWFNAWHYQEEEHLLGALVEALREEAVPPLWSPAGIRFRTQLLYLRTRRHLVATAVMVVALAASLIYFAGTSGAIERAATALTNWESILSGENRAPTGFLIAAVISLTTILRGFAAFGVTKTRIGAFLLSGFRLADAGSPGFRHRFARSFRDATTALGDRRIVLIIDDLDRCSPKQVMSVLETVNFLTNAGPCFVVLVADLGRVEHGVAMQYEEERVRMAAIDPSSAADPLTYARRYLEKLINIHVPIPLASQEQSRAVLVGTSEPAVTPRAGWAIREVWPDVRAALPSLAGWGAVVAGIFLINSIMSRPEPLRPPPVFRSGASSAPAVSVARAATQAGQPKGRPLHEARVLLPKQPALTMFWGWVVICALLFSLTAVIGARLGQSRREHDSPDFREALALWHGVLYRSSQTPRSMKRCVNRIRFYAMLQRDNDLPPGRLHSWWLAWKQLSAPAEEDVTPEDETSEAERVENELLPARVLVPLGILQHVHPEWLEHDTFWDDTATFLRRHRNVLGDILQSDEVIPFAPYREEFERIATAS